MGRTLLNRPIRVPLRSKTLHDQRLARSAPEPAVTRRSAFTLIEAMIALSITSLRAVLLLSVQSSLDTTIEAVDRTIADGVAQQTMDEVLTKRWSEQATVRDDELGAADE